MKNIFFIVVVGLTLFGCSTVPVNTTTANQLPSERIYDNKYFQKRSDDQAKVTFLRDKGFTGSGCSHDLFVNNYKVFSIRQNEQATIYLEPNYYIFRLDTGAGLCPNISTSQETELKPKSEAEYRILIPSDMNLRLTRMK